MPVICVEQFGQFIAMSVHLKANTEAESPESPPTRNLFCGLTEVKLGLEFAMKEQSTGG
jgi:hypothetical protein